MDGCGDSDGSCVARIEDGGFWVFRQRGGFVVDLEVVVLGMELALSPNVLSVDWKGVDVCVMEWMQGC